MAGRGKGNFWLGKRKFFAMITLKPGLVLEGIDMRGAPFHEEENHAFRAWDQMGCLRFQRFLRQCLLLQQGRQRKGPEAQRRIFQDVAS